MSAKKEWIVGIYDPNSGGEVTLLVRDAQNKTDAKSQGKGYIERKSPGWIKKGFSITAYQIDSSKPITEVHNVEGG